MARDRRARERDDVRSPSIRRSDFTKSSSPTENVTERSDWEQLPTDPDLERDLDYEPMTLEIVRAKKNGRDHFMYLPEEEMLDKDAFIVADAASVCDPTERR